MTLTCALPATPSTHDALTVAGARLAGRDSAGRDSAGGLGGGDPARGPAAITTAVVGASGYTGALLAELLLRHPGVTLAQASSEQLAGAPVAEHLPRLRTSLSFVAPAEVGGVDVAFVCAPHGQAAHVVARLLDDGARVVDLSADFRLDAATYADWYRPHPYPELLPGAVYGLTELHRPAIAAAAARRQPRLLSDGGADRPGASRAAGAPRRRGRRQVRRERRRQDAQRAHPLLQRRG